MNKPFRPPLRLLIPLTLFTFGIFIALLMGLVDVRRASQDAETNLMAQSKVLGIILSAGIESAFRRSQFPESRDMFRRVNNDRALETAILINEQGEIMFTSQFNLRGKNLSETHLEGTVQRVRRVMRDLRLEVYVSDDGNSVIGLFPVRLESPQDALVSEETGVLILSHHVDNLKYAAWQRSLEHSVLIAVLVALMSVGLWLVFKHTILQRLMGLIEFTDQFAHHQQTGQLDTDGEDEVAQVARALNSMAGDIQQHTVDLLNYQSFLGAALDAVPAYIAVIDQNGDITSTNSAWQQHVVSDSQGTSLFGQREGENYLAFCTQAAGNNKLAGTQVAKALHAVFASVNGEKSLEYQCLSSSRYFNLRMKAFNIQQQPHVLVAHIDISDLKQSVLEIAAAESRFRALYNENPAMFFTLDARGRIMSVNKFGASQLQYSPEDLVGTELSKLYVPEHHQSVKEFLERCVRQRGTVARWEAEMEQRAGEAIRFRHTGRMIRQAGGEIAVLMVCEDISEAFKLSQELNRLARTDSLTGLLNRYEFERRLERAIGTAKTDTSNHIVAYIDLDQFKIINDTSGHIAGDELLRQFARIISRQLRKQDTLARLGGDEFGILMENCSLPDGKRIASQLCESAESFRFVWEKRSFIIGASIGLTVIHDKTIDTTEVLRSADAACYAAKETGRNQVRVYKPTDDALIQRNCEMQWLSQVQQAMDEGRIELYYQPIVASRARTPAKLNTHYEILVRMRSAVGEILPPGLFLPSIERFDLAPKFDRHVIAQCFQWLANNPAHLQELSLCSINLSGNTIGDERLVSFILAEAGRHHIPTRQICFEVTETAAIANLGQGLETIIELRKNGFKIALDDFGTGMSSFAYLKNLPVDYLKIDGVFIKDILNDQVDEAMVRSIGELARILGKQTIAEFVESAEIVAKLNDIGIDYLQGYALSRPAPLQEISDLAHVIPDE